jgi:hypothetical protein
LRSRADRLGGRELRQRCSQSQDDAEIGNAGNALPPGGPQRIVEMFNDKLTPPVVLQQAEQQVQRFRGRVGLTGGTA